MSRKKQIFSCDFETNTQENNATVWAWIALEIESEKYIIGNNIFSFMEWLLSDGRKCYFHNLKFDATWILMYLLKNGYEYNPKKRELKNMQFNTLISGEGQFYNITIKHNNQIIDICDSYKLLPFPVKKIAKDFGLKIRKGEIDYHKKRKINHKITNNEKAYLINDALIIAQALKIMFSNDFSKMTIGSNAFDKYKKMVGDEKFDVLFPTPLNDEYIRKTYKGGFTYVNEKIAHKDIKDGLVFDVNSLYPSVLRGDYLYPVGEGEYFTGEYKKDKKKPIYFIRIRCNFKLKKNHIPTIQIKNSIYFIGTEYLKSSKNDMVELYLTCVDFELFKKHYKIIDIDFIDGYKYEAKKGLFNEYIDFWYNEKNKAKQNHNSAMYTIAKLMLNSLYGKFATNPKCTSKVPYLKDEGTLAFFTVAEKDKKPIYIPVGSMVTAYARKVIIENAQKNYNRFLYADTDSLHLRGLDTPKNLDISDYVIGAFKLEGIFTMARYLRSKLYIEKIREPHEAVGSEQWKITGAGMTDSIKQKVTFENFKTGTQFDGKLRPKYVSTGLILEETTFTIR